MGHAVEADRRRDSRRRNAVGPGVGGTSVRTDLERLASRRIGRRPHARSRRPDRGVRSRRTGCGVSHSRRRPTRRTRTSTWRRSSTRTVTRTSKARPRRACSHVRPRTGGASIRSSDRAVTSRLTAAFTAVRTEDALLPAALRHRIARRDSSLPDVDAASLKLGSDERMQDEVKHAWTLLLAAWAPFCAAINAAHLDAESAADRGMDPVDVGDPASSCRHAARRPRKERPAKPPKALRRHRRD